VWLVHDRGWDRRVIGAGGASTIIVACLLSLGAAMLLKRRASSPTRVAEPHRVLHVQPSADRDLITIAYQHLFRRAAAGGETTTLQALQAAYTLLAAPAVIGVHDRRTARRRAREVSAQAAPPAQHPDRRPARRVPRWLSATARAGSRIGQRALRAAMRV